MSLLLSLRNRVGDDVDGSNVESLIKKHEDFDRAINAQEEKIAAIESFADRLMDVDHYDGPNIVERRGSVRQQLSRQWTGVVTYACVNFRWCLQVLERWNLLKAALIDNRSRLGEAQNLQQFSRDCDGLEAWIAEKMQVRVVRPCNAIPADLPPL